MSPLSPPSALPPTPSRLTPQQAVERTVAALKYELVDVERGASGLLRVTIDRVTGVSYPTGESATVTIDDCEAVTRQLQYVLEVDQIDYARLEVSSPGLDRPLRTPDDFVRFVGEAAEVTLKAPFKGRKRFRGVLAKRDDGLRLMLDDSVGIKVDTRRVLKKKPADADSHTLPALDFQFDEVRDARLVPIVDFKGKSAAQQRMLRNTSKNSTGDSES